MAQLFRTVLLAVCTMAALTIPVRVGMIGERLSWQYYAFGGPYTNGINSGTFTVTGGVGGTFEYGSMIYFNIVADDTSVTF
jgi:hypothetical protein